jgi:hypothetical protein
MAETTQLSKGSIYVDNDTDKRVVLFHLDGPIVRYSFEGPGKGREYTTTAAAFLAQFKREDYRTDPLITSVDEVDNEEATTLAHTLTSNETVTWEITGGVDAAQFAVSDQTLTWVANGVQAFDTPLDDDADNVYVVEVTATDVDDNESTPQTISVTVTEAA